MTAATRQQQLAAIFRSAVVIPVLTIERVEDAVPLARALVAGGVRVLEVTLRTPVAVEAARAMIAEVPALGREGLVDYGALPKADAKAKAAGVIAYPIKDFYMTNPIARASQTMQRCSAELLHGADLAEAAE